MQPLTPSYQKRFTRGHHGYHHNIVVMYDGAEIELESGAGSNDRISIFTDGRLIYVLSENRLPYVGLSIYDPAARNKEAMRYDVGESEEYLALGESGSVFLQEGHVEESLGEAWDDMGPLELVKALIEYT